MSGSGIEEWAQGFFEQQAQLIANVLPFEPSVDAVLNEQTDKITAEIIVDLSYSGHLVTAENEACCTSSNLYDLRVEYRTGFDRLGRFPTVLYSTFQIRAAGKAAIRFEYERDKSNVPAAHIHVHGVGGLLSPGLMKNGKKGSRSGDWQHLHLPVGGTDSAPPWRIFSTSSSTNADSGGAPDGRIRCSGAGSRASTSSVPPLFVTHRPSQRKPSGSSVTR